MSVMALLGRPRPRHTCGSGHRPLGGWNLRDDGSWSRVYVRRGAGLYRRATVFRRDGLWYWEVEAFDAARKTRRVIGRCGSEFGKLSAERQFGYADLAARTKE